MGQSNNYLTLNIDKTTYFESCGDTNFPPFTHTNKKKKQSSFYSAQ